MTKPSKIYIVRLWDKESDPMVGEISPSGNSGMLCWDPQVRNFRPYTQVLVDKNTHNIIGLDLSRFK